MLYPDFLSLLWSFIYYIHSYLGKKWFRVLIGKFQTAKDAASLAEKMREQEGFPDSTVYSSGAEVINP